MPTTKLEPISLELPDRLYGDEGGGQELVCVVHGHVLPQLLLAGGDQVAVIAGDHLLLHLLHLLHHLLLLAGAVIHHVLGK